jgi:hypothetical protein
VIIFGQLIRVVTARTPALAGGIYELLADTSIVEYQFRIRTPGGDVEDVVVLAN